MEQIKTFNFEIQVDNDGVSYCHTISRLCIQLMSQNLPDQFIVKYEMKSIKNESINFIIKKIQETDMLTHHGQQISTIVPISFYKRSSKPTYKATYSEKDNIISIIYKRIKYANSHCLCQARADYPVRFIRSADLHIESKHDLNDPKAQPKFKVKVKFYMLDERKVVKKDLVLGIDFERKCFTFKGIHFKAINEEEIFNKLSNFLNEK